MKTYEKSMQIKLQQVKRTLARQYVIFMNTTPMCQNLDSSPIPKQGGSYIHAVQKLGYTVLNMAPHRLIQEEVKLMHSGERKRERESEWRRVPPTNSIKAGEGNETLHYF